MRFSQSLTQLPPLSLYVHIPWCVKKCPYCDFNSHTQTDDLPIDDYLAALAKDLEQDKYLAQGREIQSIFFGGGTPSLFPGQAIEHILNSIHRIIGIASHAEITLETNPGTAEYDNLKTYLNAGVNRLSFGVQSFHNHQLSLLGRIHNADEAVNAFYKARQAGFSNINLDLMHGLPEQTASIALKDLEKAIELEPTHISWYQLTIEKNTEFYSRPPPLPQEETLETIQELGHKLLQTAGYQQYEISAYARHDHLSSHNLNYWQFGDYLAIGAGAHGKITRLHEQDIIRYQKTRLPKHYLAALQHRVLQKEQNPTLFNASETPILARSLPLEFLMNALRLKAGVPRDLYVLRTGLPLDTIAQKLDKLQKNQLLDRSDHAIQASEHGYKFLDSILQEFM